MSDQDDRDAETLIAILILLQKRDPEHAATYALIAQQAALDAQAAAAKFGDYARAKLEAAADAATNAVTEANVELSAAESAVAVANAELQSAEAAVEAAEASGDAAATAAAESAVNDALQSVEAAKSAAAIAAAADTGFEEIFREKLATTLDALGGTLEQVLANIVLPAYNEGRYSAIFGGADGANAWEFTTAGDAKVCPNCRELAGHRFAWDDVAGRHILPLTHWGDRCHAEPLYDYAGPVDAGEDFLEFVDPEFAYDKGSGIAGLRRAA